MTAPPPPAPRCPDCGVELLPGERDCPICGGPDAPDAAEARVGTRCGGYRILDLVARGAAGVVYRARPLDGGPQVALKVLHLDTLAGIPGDPKEDLAREARAVSLISHPGVVRLHDWGETEDGAAFLVMELLVGETLEAAMERRGAFGREEALDLVLQMADVLQAVHAAGIVHRDIKPANVFLVREAGRPWPRVKLLDFGVAKVRGLAPSWRTQGGLVPGTPHYMAPEQARGAPVDRRTDVYALGVVFYQLVTGDVPFDGATPMDVLRAHLTAAPPPVRGPGADPMVAAVIRRCLARDPAARYQSMGELAAAMRTLWEPMRDEEVGASTLAGY